MSQTPDQLSDSDWSGIRGAYERNRLAIAANPDGTHHARNPGQAWVTKFDGRGFTVNPDAGGWSWGLELVGYGEATAVRQDDGKISFDRGDGLTEWFVNDARGLEQGWTLENRPERAGDGGEFHLNLAVRGGLRPDVSATEASVAFVNDVGTATLTYGGLKAWDANGKTVPTRFEAGEPDGSGFRVAVDDAGAVYPITVDPMAQQAYLKASNTEAGDYFGRSVAVSGDTVVVGAPFEDSGTTSGTGNQADNSASNSGAAYVFVRSGAVWTQQAYLKANFPRADDYFGWSVAVSGDTVVVGATGEDNNATGVNGDQGHYYNNAPDSGVAYVFVRSGTAWTQQAYFKASNAGQYDNFGYSVSVSGDTVVVGAPQGGSPYGAFGSGAVYVFVRGGTAWTQQAYLKASNAGASDNFGYSVAVSGDTVVVGAYGEDSAATGVNGIQTDNSAASSGAVYVFVRSGTVWTQQSYLKASNAGAGDNFGRSVALSGDTVVVGAYGEASGVNGNQADNSVSDSGAAYVFVRSGTAWTQQAYLKSSNAGESYYFGYAVAVSGNTVVATTAVDEAYVFVRGGTAWTQQAFLKASNAWRGDSFGYAVAVSDGTVVVGAFLEDSAATGVNGNQTDNSADGSGAAYVFSPRSILSTLAEHGTVTGGGEYERHATATLAATPAPGYLFAGWSGDATGTVNPLSVLMDADKTVTATFTPDTNDDDSDGLTNYQEIVESGTNPALPDTDGDGAKDSKDAFPLDPAETLDTDRDGTGDNADADDDGDGYSDEDEINIHHTDPKRADSDGDGLSDPAELETHHTNPNVADTDNDGLRDGEEFTTYHTNPLLGDTDGDGFLDGYEVLTGKLPLDPLDKPALVAEARTAIEFTFPAAVGKTYRIEASTDLAAWEIVETGIAGTGGQVQRFYSTRGQPKRYFRVEEVAP